MESSRVYSCIILFQFTFGKYLSWSELTRILKRGLHLRTKFAILTSEAFLCKNKKYQQQWYTSEEWSGDLYHSSMTLSFLHAPNTPTLSRPSPNAPGRVLFVVLVTIPWAEYLALHSFGHYSMDRIS